MLLYFVRKSSAFGSKFRAVEKVVLQTAARVGAVGAKVVGAGVLRWLAAKGGGAHQALNKGPAGGPLGWGFKKGVGEAKWDVSPFSCIGWEEVGERLNFHTGAER